MRISTVHTLKGSAGMLGAPRLATVAAQLQIDLESGNGCSVEDGARRLREELTAFGHRVNARLALLGLPGA
jgi:HPt (histidine-containing phosphotransfer) domain-containing protein